MQDTSVTLSLMVTVNNIKAFEKVVRCMKESGIGYGSINHPVDRDPVLDILVLSVINVQCGRRIL